MTELSNAQRWSRIESLLDLALTLPPARRAEFLAQESGGDVGVLREVQALLADAETRDDVFARPAAALIQALVSAALPEGTRLGAYRVLELVGRGGMGEVYRAERADGAFEQQVALKLVRREAIEHLERFEAERQVLARLEHPGIARLYDGGVAADGRPYMVMEWIEGKPLTDWCRERGADLKQRLEIFLQVCQAVAYAHRNLLVHRDLKPGNVLVTADGRTKLLDFGVAKLLAGSDLALYTEAPVTPAYAAPEQLRQAPVTTAADVFALGLLLFELLTGERPWHRPQMTLVALIEKLLNESAPAPSATAASLAAPPVPPKNLRGDLDAIVAKTLRQEPEHRYETVAALEADLQRHLRSEPVTALRGARGYVLGRFLLRYRWTVAAVFALVLTLGAGLVGTTWQARVAQREAARATAIKDFLIGIFRASDPRIAQDKPRGQITAKELLDASAPKINERFADDPDTRIELLGVAASIYRELGDESSYRPLRQTQTELARQHHGEQHPAIIAGLIDDAHYANERNDYAAALKLLEQADPLIRRAGLDRSLTRARWWLVRSDVVFDGDENQDLGEKARDQAIALYAEIAPTDPGYVRALSQKAYGLNRADPVAAEQLFLRALAAAEASAERDDSVLQQLTYPGLAQALEDQGKYDAAMEAYDQGAALVARTHGETHSTAWVPAAQYAWTLHRYGHRERAHRQFERLLRVIPPDWTHDSYDEYAREFYADRLAREGRAAQAIPLLEHALQAYIAQPGVEYEQRRNRLILGDAYDRVGRSAEARAMIKASLDERIAKEPPDSQTVLAARERWGRFLIAQGDTAAAEEQLREIMQQAGARRIEPLALAHAALAQLALVRGNSAALDASRAAVQTFEQLTGRRDVRSGPQIWLIHSEALRRSGDFKTAREWAMRALEASRRYDDPSAPSIAQAEAAVRAAAR